jgi:hypothetical protein
MRQTQGLLDKDRTTLHIFLPQYSDKEIDHNDENYDRLWKIREMFDMLNVAYSKFYNPSERSAIDEVIIRFKGRVVFKQCIPKKHK